MRADVSYSWGSWTSVPAVKPRTRDGKTIRQIVEDVAERHGFLTTELLGPRRFKSLSRARFEAMWLVRQERWPDGRHVYSLTQIGDFFGGRDHTTALNAIRRWEEISACSPNVHVPRTCQQTRGIE